MAQVEPGLGADTAFAATRPLEPTKSKAEIDNIDTIFFTRILKLVVTERSYAQSAYTVRAHIGGPRETSVVTRYSCVNSVSLPIGAVSIPISGMTAM